MYADQIDEAAARQQQMIDNALANRPRPTMVYTGECHWCEEPIDKGHYCNSDCRKDHEVMVWAESQRKLA